VLTRRTLLLATITSGASVALWPSRSYAAGPGALAVNSARSQVGVPYRWRGAQPGVGFDCSGLTMWAWSQAGVGLNHSSYDQATKFEVVSPDRLMLGDLVFNESRGHVVIYSGNGNGISAPRSGEQVREAPLTSTALCVRPTRPVGAGGGGTAPAPSPAAAGEHIVRPGETLSGIALRYGATIERLMALNGITNPDRVQVGRKLRIR
jgi:NlpC/P60 family/LysM domain